jgi:RNA polymerase sigma-70 factor, ECF subfamily
MSHPARPLRVISGGAAATSDAELVARANSGDQWAIEAIYRKHVDRVTTVAARLLRNRADVEDTVQEVFIRAFTELSTLRDPTRLGQWLAASVVHRAHKVFRRRKLQRLLGMHRSVEDEPLADQLVDDVTPETRSEIALLDRVLSGMADVDRTAWVLRHLLGHRIPEVAELTGCSLATTHRRLARAQSIVDATFGSTRND